PPLYKILLVPEIVQRWTAPANGSGYHSEEASFAATTASNTTRLATPTSAATAAIASFRRSPPDSSRANTSSASPAPASPAPAPGRPRAPPLRQRRPGPRHPRHPPPRLDRRRHQAVTGIGYRRHPRVRHHHHPRAAHQLADQVRGPRRLVRLEVRHDPTGR